MSIKDVMQNTPRLKLTNIVFADWHKWTYPECEAFVDAVEGLILDVISKTNVPDEPEISNACCSYCGLTIANANEDILVFMQEHIRHCSYNPMVQEIVELKKQLSDFLAAGNRANLQLGCCGSAAAGVLDTLTTDDPGWSTAYHRIILLGRAYQKLLAEKEQLDTASTPDPKIGDTVWIKGIIERPIGHEFLVRFPDDSSTWVDKEKVKK